MCPQEEILQLAEILFHQYMSADSNTAPRPAHTDFMADCRLDVSHLKSELVWHLDHFPGAQVPTSSHTMKPIPLKLLSSCIMDIAATNACDHFIILTSS